MEKYPDELGDIIGDDDVDDEVFKNVGDDPIRELYWELLSKGRDVDGEGRDIAVDNDGGGDGIWGPGFDL